MWIRRELEGLLSQASTGLKLLFLIPHVKPNHFGERSIVCREDKGDPTPWVRFR